MYDIKEQQQKLNGSVVALALWFGRTMLHSSIARCVSY